MVIRTLIVMAAMLAFLNCAKDGAIQLESDATSGCQKQLQSFLECVDSNLPYYGSLVKAYGNCFDGFDSFYKCKNPDNQ